MNRPSAAADSARKHLAIIPARGGSRRIPRKNIKAFAGQPMIAYALQAAQQSGLFAHIAVSTDDDEIAAIASQYGASVPGRRPAALADDHTPIVPVVQHTITACRELGWQFEHVCCIFPCVPLLSSDDIVRAHASMVQAGADYAFTVCEFPSSIFRALRQLPDGSVESFFPEHTQTRTQDLEQGYFDCGQVYWGTPDAWLSGRSPHRGGQACLMPAWRAVDIDTPDDWARAEAMFAAIAPNREP
jgi:pseudaminic acid cytidylyltransferase